MCDYSLAGLRSRLAVTGEELIAYRFPTGSIGLTSPAELEAHKHEVRGWWSRLRAHDWPCAVCVPPGARLVLRDIPKRLQTQLGLKETEEATFIQIDALRQTPGRPAVCQQSGGPAATAGRRAASPGDLSPLGRRAGGVKRRADGAGRRGAALLAQPGRFRPCGSENRMRLRPLP